MCKDTVNWRNNKLPKIYFSQAGQISTRHALHFAVVSVPAWGMEVFTDLIRRQGSRPWQPFYIRSDQASHPLAGRRSLYWEKMSCHLMNRISHALNGGILTVRGIAFALHFPSHLHIAEKPCRTHRQYRPHPKPKAKMDAMDNCIEILMQGVVNGTLQISMVEQIDKIRNFHYSPLFYIITQPVEEVLCQTLHSLMIKGKGNIKKSVFGIRFINSDIKKYKEGKLIQFNLPIETVSL